VTGALPVRGAGGGTERAVSGHGGGARRYGAAVAQHREIRPGYTVIHPNRDRPVCKVTRILVVVVLLISVALMLVITVGGWSKLEGMTSVNFIWCALYVVMAIFIARWARGLLPIAAVLGLLLLAIALIATVGFGGTSWFDRSHASYGAAHALGGGQGLGSATIGTLVLLLVPVELVLILLAVAGFAQGWNVELEVPDAEAAARRRGGGRAGRDLREPRAAAT
jgi:hypothetical protein